jgi:hypothetical protein
MDARWRGPEGECGVIDLSRLLADLGRIRARLERTDPLAGKTLEAVIQRINDGRYDRQEVPIAEPLTEVVERF